MIFFRLERFKNFFLIFLLFFFSCQNATSPSNEAKHCSPFSLITGSIIIGNNDWKDYTKVGDNSQNENEMTVAQIKIPRLNASCNGFLINERVLMTNNHCISSSLDSQKVKAIFRDDVGNRFTYSCEEFIYTNSQLDFTLIACSGDPGKKFGWVSLAATRPEVMEEIYTVEENCDYIKDPYCTVYKFVSYGHLLKSQENKMIYDLDTLPGSSGSPVFLGKTQMVVALHHAGIYGTTNVEAANEGIPMIKIRADIESHTAVKLIDRSNESPPLSTVGSSSQGCSKT